MKNKIFFFAALFFAPCAVFGMEQSGASLKITFESKNIKARSAYASDNFPTELINVCPILLDAHVNYAQQLKEKMSVEHFASYSASLEGHAVLGSRDSSLVVLSVGGWTGSVFVTDENRLTIEDCKKTITSMYESSTSRDTGITQTLCFIGQTKESTPITHLFIVSSESVINTAPELAKILGTATRPGQGNQDSHLATKKYEIDYSQAVIGEKVIIRISGPSLPAWINKWTIGVGIAGVAALIAYYFDAHSKIKHIFGY